MLNLQNWQGVITEFSLLLTEYQLSCNE